MANWYDVPSSITGLEWAAGLYIPNRDFADWDDAIDGTSYTGDDGEPGYRSGFSDWYYRLPGSGSESVEPYDVGGAGYTAQSSYLGPGAIYLYTDTNRATVDWDDHNTYSVCAYTGMLPLGRIFPTAYARQWRLAFSVRANRTISSLADCCAIALSQYDSSFNHLQDNTFILTNKTATSSYWTNHEVNISGDLDSTTRYVILQIAVRAYTTTTGLAFDQLSLFTDALNSSQSVSTRQLSGVYYRGVPRTSWLSPGLLDSRMMDGHTERRNTNPSWLKHQIALEWYREDEENYDELLKMAAVSKRGWGGTITEPCPICVQPGFGAGPYWAYYHVIGTTMDGTFNTRDKDAGFDIGLQLQEV